MMLRLRSLARRRHTRAFHYGVAPTTASPASLQQQQRDHLRTETVVTVPLQAPIFQIYGSNTDVGKTVLSAGICDALLRKNNHQSRVVYIKPLQTGISASQITSKSLAGDAKFIHDQCKHNANHANLECSTLFSWELAASPHLSARQENFHVSDQELLQTLEHKLHQSVVQSHKPTPYVLVETAGGALSPSASMRPQADVYRSFRLPVILMGDGKLGGISGTLATLDSLMIRGYDIAAICLIEQDDLNNAEAMEARCDELQIPLFAMHALPPLPEPLDQWFTKHDDQFDHVANALDQFHADRLAKLHEMSENVHKVFWWPFTQHKRFGQLTVIDSAHGDEFCVWNKHKNELSSMFDACASWWTQGVGHGNAKMSTALAYAASRYGHVMFPENAHEPAYDVTTRLLDGVGKNWASRVFFSDDGSTAIEIALKMSFRKYICDHELEYNLDNAYLDGKKLVVLAQENCYHGDTLGTLVIGEPSIFNAKQHPWYRPEAMFVSTPSVSYHDGQCIISVEDKVLAATTKETELPTLKDRTFDNFAHVCDLQARDNSTLAQVYRNYVVDILDNQASQDKKLIGTLMLEPVLIGCGGMIVVDPLYQRVLVQESQKRRIPVMFDEVFSGFYRLGVQSARDLLGVNPDIACYAKLFTGGVIPMAVTVTSEPVFESFVGDSKREALLHGHSFTANPVGCAAAITAMDMYQVVEQGLPMASNQVTRAYWDVQRVRELSRLPHVRRAFEIGTVFILEMESSVVGYHSNECEQLVQGLRDNKVYARSLGNVVYMMCSPLTSQQDCDKYLDILSHQVQCTRK